LNGVKKTCPAQWKIGPTPRIALRSSVQPQKRTARRRRASTSARMLNASTVQPGATMRSATFGVPEIRST